MRQIFLSQNKIALVDNEDFESLSKWNWHYSGGYAVRKETVASGKRKKISMHRIVMNTLEGFETDHIDGNGLNNQKHNLRICTRSENCQNARIRKDNSSGFKGVSFVGRTGKFIVSIAANKKSKFVGNFDTARAAAVAYNIAAKKLHGSFAKLNNIETQ